MSDLSKLSSIAVTRKNSNEFVDLGASEFSSNAFNRKIPQNFKRLTQ